MKSDVDLIKKRNRKVEMDKTWETSKTIRLIIIVLTYFFIENFAKLIK